MIRLESIEFSYPGAAPLLRDLSLDVPSGQFCVIVGASGSGKSTVLRLVNALLRPRTGRVHVHGRDTAGADPVALRRGIGYVPQRGGLLPHMTARENAALVPRLLGWAPERAAAAAEEALSVVQLPAPEYGDRYPDELSGGQRQRVSVARALAAKPDIVLMDEPFGALDNALREELQDELGPLLRRLGKTVLFVTHDMHEAAHLADRLVVMDAGRVLADGSPAEVVLGAKDPVVERLLGRRRRDLERFVRDKDAGHG